MRKLLQDLRFAFRQLRKSPMFAASVIATLALGIGANTAIFSIVDAVLLRPLSYKNSDRLIVVWQTDPIHRGTGAWFDSYREFETWRNSNRSFEKLAALSWATSGKAMMWHGKAVGLLALPASADFFSMLGAKAQIGRTFASVDAGNSCTLVISYPFWQEKLGAPEDIAGQSVTVDRSSCVVVGVMPKDFSFYPAAANAWSLITPSSEFEQKPWESMTGVFGLLKPGVTRAQAEAELNAIEKRILPEAPASLGALTSSMPVILDLHDNFTWLAGGKSTHRAVGALQRGCPHLADGVPERGQSPAHSRDGSLARNGRPRSIRFKPCTAGSANANRVFAAGVLWSRRRNPPRGDAAALVPLG